MTITLIIIIITVLTSIASFTNDKVYNDFIFYPPAVTYDKQWWRFLTCGLIHADWCHLIFNMYAFYMFGDVEDKFAITPFPFVPNLLREYPDITEGTRLFILVNQTLSHY